MLFSEKLSEVGGKFTAQRTHGSPILASHCGGPFVGHRFGGGRPFGFLLGGEAKLGWGFSGTFRTSARPTLALTPFGGRCLLGGAGLMLHGLGGLDGLGQILEEIISINLPVAKETAADVQLFGVEQGGFEDDFAKGQAFSDLDVRLVVISGFHRHGHGLVFFVHFETYASAFHGGDHTLDGHAQGLDFFTFHHLGLRQVGHKDAASGGGTGADVRGQLVFDGDLAFENFFIAAPTLGGGSHRGDKGDLTAEGAFGNGVDADLHLQAGLHLVDAALVNLELHFHFGKIRQVNDVLPLAQGGAFLDDAGGAAVA